MNPLTLEQLAKICRQIPGRYLEIFVEPLIATFSEFAISTPARQAAFLAQVAHESAGFRALRELASGDAYEPPSRLAAHLGNTEPGDGRRFKGRGLLQITGRKNYGFCAEALTLPLLEHPEYLEEPVQACRSAGWFWTAGAGMNLGVAARAHGVPIGVNLNDLADAGDFLGITLAINGGTNGLEDRQARYEAAQGVLA